MATNISKYRGSIDFIGRYAFDDEGKFAYINDGYISVDSGLSSSPTLRFNNTSTGIYAPSPDVLGFVTDGQERVRIDGDGYLSISTPDAIEKLTVNGAMALSEVPEPAADPEYGKIYMKDNGLLYFKNNTGSEFALTAGDLSGSGPVAGSGGAGRVAFWTGATTVSGVTQLYWNNTTQRLGVGGSSPQRRLDVFGDIGSSDSVWIAKSGDAFLSIENTSVADNPNYKMGSVDVNQLNFSFSDDLTAERVVFSVERSGILRSRLVGLGTCLEGYRDGETNPLVKLTHEGLEFRDPLSDIATGTSIGRSDEGVIVISGGAVPTLDSKAIISSDGLLLLGDNAATSSNTLSANSVMVGNDLEVDGYVWVDGGIGIRGDFGFSGVLRSDGYIVPFTDDTYSVGLPDSRWCSMFVGSGSYHILSTDSENTSGQERDWSLGANSSGNLGFSEGYVELFTFTENGRQGIGTDNPQSKLHIVGDALATGGFRIGDYPGGDSVLIDNDGTAVEFRDSSDLSYAVINTGRLMLDDGSVAVPALSFHSSPTLGISRPSNNTMAFNVAGVESFRINPAGGISINTTTQPTSPSKLLVGGGAGITVEGNSSFGTTVVAHAPVTVGGDISLVETVAPAFTSGFGKVYVSSVDNDLHFVDSAGNDLNISSLGTGITLANASDKRIAFFTGTTTIEGEDRLIWDYTNNRLGVNTDIPQNTLDVEGAAVIGTNYSGAITAPVNGLLVQGYAGFGTTVNVDEPVVVGGAVSLSFTSPPTETANYGKIYAGLDGELYFKRDDGADVILTDSSGSGQLGQPTDGSYTGLLGLQEDDKVNDAIDQINDVLALIAPVAPDDLTGESLSLSVSSYSAKLPSGLSSAWSPYTPGDTVTTLIITPTYSLISPNTSITFNGGLTSTDGGVVTHVLDGADADTRNVSSGVGSSGAVQITAIDTYNNIWQKINARINRTQTEGQESHALKHSLAGTSNTSTLYYDDVNDSPSFSVTPTFSVNSETLKYLSGVGYYTTGTEFLVSYTAASGIFRKAYHPTFVSRIACTGSSTINVNPVAVPAVDDTFVVSDQSITLNAANQGNTNPSITVYLYKPNGASANSSTSTLARYICTYGTQSTTSYDNFVDEAQRLELGASTPWTSSSALTNGNAQVRCGSLQYPSTSDYPGFTGAQAYERRISKAAASNGNIVFSGLLSYTDITEYNTGNINVFLCLETEGIWFDLGRPFGSDNGTGSGDSPANSKGALNLGGSSGTNLAFTFGTYSTANNNNAYRLRVVFFNSAKSLNSITAS